MDTDLTVDTAWTDSSESNFSRRVMTRRLMGFSLAATSSGNNDCGWQVIGMSGGEVYVAGSGYASTLEAAMQAAEQAALQEAAA